MTIPKGHVPNHRFWRDGRKTAIHSWEFLSGMQLCFPWGIPEIATFNVVLETTEKIKYESLKDAVIFKRDPPLVKFDPPMEKNGQLIIPFTNRTLEEEFCLAVGDACKPFLKGSLSNIHIASMLHAVEKIIYNYKRRYRI